jgi:glutathione S-transferase
MTEKPVLWGRGSSTNVQKVLWAVGELGIQVEHRIVGGEHGGTDTPAFRSLNPNGTVPVWQERDFALWESHAILRYLARREGRLYGASAHEIARTDQWLDWTAQVFWPPVRLLFLDVYRAGRTPSEVAGAEAAIARTHQTLKIADAAFLSEADDQAASPSIAGIALGIAIHRLVGLGYGIDLPPKLAAWHGAVRARPAFIAATLDEPDYAGAPPLR